MPIHQNISSWTRTRFEHKVKKNKKPGDSPFSSCDLKQVAQQDHTPDNPVVHLIQQKEHNSAAYRLNKLWPFRFNICINWRIGWQTLNMQCVSTQQVSSIAGRQSHYKLEYFMGWHAPAAPAVGSTEVAASYPSNLLIMSIFALNPGFSNPSKWSYIQIGVAGYPQWIYMKNPHI